MALTLIAESGEPLGLSNAKQHLGVLHTEADTEILALVTAARDYCERFTQRILRSSVTWQLTRDSFWTRELWLPWPPLLTFTSITYYDTDNASQTLAAGNYEVENSTHGAARIVWADTVDLPNHFSRHDAVTVNFISGYATTPPAAVHAIKTKLTELWGRGTEGELKAAAVATDRLLGLVDWSGYA